MGSHIQKQNMIGLILFLITLETLSAQQNYPDYYAVNTYGKAYGYKVFTRKLKCTDPVYESGDNRVLLKVGRKWILGSLYHGNGLECQNIASTIYKKYESTGSDLTNGQNWFNIKESQTHNKKKIKLGIKSFNRCEEIPRLRLGTASSLFSKEDCESKDYWATKYPGQTVIVSSIEGFSQCSFDTRKDVELFEGRFSKLFIHSSCGNQTDDLLPDFYAIKSKNSGHGYRIYSKIRNCKAYRSGDQVLYQDGDLMKLATLNRRSQDLECKNIGSTVDSSKDSYMRRGELPTEEFDRTYYIFTSTFYKRQMITMEIEFLQKCEEKIDFRVLEWNGTHTEAVSKEKCESRYYWNKKYPDENLIVSFFHNKCHFEYTKDVAYLVKDHGKKAFVHCSVEKEIGKNGQIGGKDKKHPKKGNGEKDQIINNRIAKVKPTEEQGSSKNKGNLSLVIYICSGAGFLVLVVLVGIGVKRRQAKEKEVTVVEINTIYGRNDPEDYYEDGEMTQIEDM